MSPDIGKRESIQEELQTAFRMAERINSIAARLKSRLHEECRNEGVGTIAPIIPFSDIALNITRELNAAETNLLHLEQTIFSPIASITNMSIQGSSGVSNRMAGR